MRQLVLIGLLASAGCLDSLEPDVGPPARAACSNVDSDPAVDVSYQLDLVDNIFKRGVLHCVKCHTVDGESPIGYLVGGLDLGSYQGLMKGGAQGGADIVVPGQPCASVLFQKVGAGVPFGARMPLDGPPYLSERDMHTVADWIAEGARDN